MFMRVGMFAGTVLAVCAAATTTVAAPAPVAKPPSFAMCGVCHKVGKNEPSAIGPNLFGIGGRKAGTLPGYAFSPAMKGAKITWTRDQLIVFIRDPRGKVPGTKMAFAGQKNPQMAAAIADYLLSLK